MFNKTLLALSLAGLTGMTVAHADSHTLDTTATDDTGYAATTTTDSAAAYAAPVGTGEFTDDRWYAAPFGTFVQPGGDRNAQGGWGAGLAIGKIINEYFNVEVRGFWQNWGNNGVANVGQPIAQGRLGQGWIDGGTDLTGGTVDLQYYFLRDTFSPYAVFGLGGVNNSWRGSSLGATTWMVAARLQAVPVTAASAPTPPPSSSKPVSVPRGNWLTTSCCAVMFATGATRPQTTTTATWVYAAERRYSMTSSSTWASSFPSVTSRVPPQQS